METTRCINNFICHSALTLILTGVMACSGGSVRESNPMGPDNPPQTAPPTTPTVTISSPTANQTFLRGEFVTFSLETVIDPGRTVSWESSRDGVLGEGARLELQNLTPGSHTVTVRIDGVAGGTVSFQMENRKTWNLFLLGSAMGDGASLGSWGNLVAVGCPLARSCKAGVAFFDLSSPAAPIPLAPYRPDDLNVWDVMLSEDLAFLASKGSGSEGFVNEIGVRILDVSDPNAPVILADITSIREVFRLYVADGFLYASTSESNETGAIHVFDVRDPSTPVQVAEVRSPLGGRAWNARVQDGRLYAIFSNENTQQSNLIVVDVFVPSAPALIGVAPVGYASDLWPSSDGRFVFLTLSGSVAVYDVTASGSPQIVATYRSLKGTEPLHIGREGSRVYLSQNGQLGFGGGVESLDVSDPTRPRLVAFYELGRIGPSAILPIGAGRVLTLMNGLQVLQSQ